MQLQYYRVAAPQAGVVGDISIRAGDRITTSTVITTIDDNAALEAYIQVPLDRVRPICGRVCPCSCSTATASLLSPNPISFVAPRVDAATQSVLAKTLLKDAPPALRVQQFVKARIVWHTSQGLTVPVIAVTRISGQYFCFVAEPQGDGLVARQRPVQVGEVLGNDYVVVGGLKAGERLIVSGIQKIGDGAPVKAE